ncbi:AbrB/MazE/SpoVT family DNA-binding domain-containing protein [Treponema primitia]|uniref:AbrB/MazE/SpoVT family DNA-binding domain-containing protein n=1 Tax=Treponema primitia TaxID=88058 RepID=UPI003980946E
MNTVTLSSKFQVVIPKAIRESIGLKAGTSFEIISYGGKIEMIPLQPIEQLEGIFKGIDTVIERDNDRI